MNNIPTFSVTELGAAIKKTLEAGFGRVRVRGELSGVKHHSNGHIYLDLKDDKAVLNAVSWRGTALSIAPENGMEVICTGRLTNYAARSNYQLVIESMELAGEGALLKLLEERKKRLAAEGLFDQARKKKLPYFPDIIGVITSPTGAVIRDILHRLEDRCPRRVLIWPVAVQGAGAAEQIANAVKGFNAAEKNLRPDIIIVARGGGSLEDLMPFNEEIVVRAVADSDIPIVSAVGHETDTTLIDFVADMRAPTPTAAAEISVPVRLDLLAALKERSRRMMQATQRVLEQKQRSVKEAQSILTQVPRQLEFFVQRLDDMIYRLAQAPMRALDTHRLHFRRQAERLRFPQHRFDQAETNLRNVQERMHRAFGHTLQKQRQKWQHTSALLESYSYRNILQRGFALIVDEAKNPIISASQLNLGQSIAILMQDGEAGANIQNIHKS